MKVKLPNWQGLHMDQAIWWSEFFRLNPRLFKRSYSFSDLCRRVSPKGKHSLGEYMAKHTWAAQVFKACKLGKCGLASPLAFPEVNKFSELWNADGTAKEHLTAWIKEHMLSDLSYFFQAIKRIDGILITATYNQIIGSRYIALLPTNARIPSNLKHWIRR